MIHLGRTSKRSIQLHVRVIKWNSTDKEGILWEHCVQPPLVKRLASPLQIKTYQKFTVLWIYDYQNQI